VYTLWWTGAVGISNEVNIFQNYFVVFSFNLFLETNKADNQVIVNNNDQTGNKEKAKIEDALQYFSERATKSTEILNSTASVVDPAQ